MHRKQNQSNLESRFLEVSPISLSASCYRIFPQKYGALNTDGTLLYSGRYNNKKFRVLYTADSKKVCEAEQARRTQIKTKFKYKIAKIDVNLRKVLDLTDEKNREKLNIRQEDIIDDSWDIPQHIATLAYQKGYEGLLVPSATGKGNNIILFPDNFTPESAIKKIAEESIYTNGIN